MRLGNGGAVTRRALGVALSAVLFFTAIGALDMPAAAAQDDDGPSAEFDSRVVTLETSYDIQPNDERVTVSETITIRNVRGSTRSGNIRTDYFWTGHTVWAAVDAENLSIASNGAELEFEQIDEVEDLVKVYSVDFPTNLNFGQTRVLDVSYELPSYPGGGLRRVNGAFFELELVTCCNFEEITIEVSAPASFTVDSPFGLDFTRSTVGGDQVWSYSDSESSGDFTDFVVGTWFGTDPDGFDRDTVDLNGAVAEVLGYPDDPRWNAQVTATVQAVGDSMQRLTGNEWSQAAPTFVQSSDGADDQLPVVGVDEWTAANSTVFVPTTVPEWAIALSVARPYVNDSNFDFDWMTESTVRDMASRSLDPQPPSGDAVPTEPTRRVTSAGNGGFWFVRQLTDAIGYDGLLELERLAGTSETAFVGAGDAESSVTIGNDWRRLLDLAEQRLGMAGAATLIEDSLLRDEEVRELRERNTTIERYDELRSRVGIDEGPIGLRTGLTNWELTEVNEMIEAAERALDEAEEIASLAAAADLEFEAATPQGWVDLASVADFEALRDGFDGERDAIAAIEASQGRLDDERGYVTSLGFDDAAAADSLAEARSSFNDGDLDGVDTSLAQFAAIEADASTAGRTRLITRVVAPIVGGVLLLVALAAFFVRRRRVQTHTVAPAAPVAHEPGAGPTEVVYPTAPPAAEGASTVSDSTEAIDLTVEQVEPPPPPTVTRF